MTTTLASAPSAAPTLSQPRLHALRGGYVFIAVGLALVKWPLLPDAASLPLFEGVTLSLLTAMALLALLGLRYPVSLLPVLLFETLWKLLWLGLVALPQTVSGSMDAATTEVFMSCSLVVVIVAVIPWRYVWRQYLRTPGDRWR